MKSIFFIFFIFFNVSIYSQSFTCLRCGGDGLIEKECSDCPNYVKPKSCYVCDGKGSVPNEKDRYFYSDNIDDIMPQLMVGISKDLSQTLKEYSPQSLQKQRIQIIKKDYKNTLLRTMKNEVATKPQEYIDSWENIELQAGNFWTNVRTTWTGTYHQYLNLGLDYLVTTRGITDAYAYGKIIPKQNVLLNVQFTSSKLFVLEPEYYLTKEAINGSKILAEGRIVEFSGEIIVHDSDNKIILNKEQKLYIRQNPFRKILTSRLNKEKENFILETEIESWTTRKDLGKKFSIVIKFLNQELKTIVIVEKKKKIVKEIVWKAFPNEVNSDYEIIMLPFYSSSWRNFYINRDWHYTKRKIFKLEWNE